MILALASSLLLHSLCLVGAGDKIGFEKQAAMVRLTGSSDTETTKLHECSDEDGSTSNNYICVQLTFPAETTFPQSVACKGLVHDAKRTDNQPSIKDFLGYSATQCQKQGCEYFIQSGIMANTDYDVFCVVWPVSNWYLHQPYVVPKCEPKASTCGLQVASGGMDIHQKFGATDLVAVTVLLAYIMFSFLFEYVRILHETGFAVVIGLICGWILKLGFNVTPQFSYNMFSYFILPMVIFAAGFNMRKKNFFRYFGYLSTLGVTGTVMIFVIIYGAGELFAHSHYFYDAAGTEVKLRPRSLLVMASVLSSTDSVAPIAFLPAASYPQLYSMIFGEGVLNDVVSILLSTSTANASSLPSFWEILKLLVYYFATSSSMGVAFGLPIAILFKHFHPLHEESVKPIAMLLLLNYACYIVSEICDISSIFALFVCAILCSHYARQHLSEEAQSFGAEVAEFFSYMAEAFVFGYFGLTAVGYLSDSSKFSYGLIFFYSGVVLFARALTVLILVVGMKLLRCWDRLALTWREWCMVGFAGCMRGTIAFALILKAMPAQSAQSPEQTILVSTVLGIVLINCLVFGGLFPLVLRLLDIQPTLSEPCTSVDNMKEDSRKLIDNPVFADVKFLVEDQTVCATRAHLAARSIYFQDMLYNNVRDEGVSDMEDHIVLSDIQRDMFLKVLEYIYTDAIEDINLDIANDLFDVSVRFRLDGLKALCKEILRRAGPISGASQRVDILDSWAHSTQDSELPLRQTTDPSDIRPPNNTLTRARSLVPHPTSLRKGVDKSWKYLDRKWFQPLFGRASRSHR